MSGTEVHDKVEFLRCRSPIRVAIVEAELAIFFHAQPGVVTFAQDHTAKLRCCMGFEFPSYTVDVYLLAWLVHTTQELPLVEGFEIPVLFQFHTVCNHVVPFEIQN